MGNKSYNELKIIRFAVYKVNQSWVKSLLKKKLCIATNSPLFWLEAFTLGAHSGCIMLNLAALIFTEQREQRKRGR